MGPPDFGASDINLRTAVGVNAAGWASYGQVRMPGRVVHGGQDRCAPRSHGEWLARRIPSAEPVLRPDDGHISVLNAGDAALDWLREHTKQD